MHHPRERRRFEETAQRWREERERAARALGYVSFSHYYRQRWLKQRRTVTEMAAELGVARGAIQQGAAELVSALSRPGGVSAAM